ncbi:hypothetical protein DFS34DRAFT_592447 [Phlyctochytrium arcticum]|nr:hypothetical protein DFS34DRAFT_592447 [Phlyctochytrium arcticum]
MLKTRPSLAAYFIALAACLLLVLANASTSKVHASLAHYRHAHPSNPPPRAPKSSDRRLPYRPYDAGFGRIDFDRQRTPAVIQGAKLQAADDPNSLNEQINRIASNETTLAEFINSMTVDEKSHSLALAMGVLERSVKPTVALMVNDRNCSFLKANWTCPAGNFCLAPSITSGANRSTAALCTAGFFCPESTYQPNYCCAGFYCPTPAQIFACPSGSWCPVGSIAPVSCMGLAWCPEGSGSVQRFVVLGIIIVIILLGSILFSCRKRSVAKRNLKYRNRLAASAEGRDEKKSTHHLEGGSKVPYMNDTLLVLGHDDDMDAEDDEHDPANVPDFVGNASAPPARSDVQRTFDIEFENLCLTLANGVEIMYGVTGSLKSGRLCAVMGPSGAGKTTFISLLTNKARRTAGSVRINGHAEELSKYRKLIGFVPQEDVMLRELTVRDILMHSALMRLPTDWTEKRKKELVLETISFLGLDHIMDNAIGSEEERGISGGQRKRVNIGMELVAAPSVLFLDEPTSGLDSATSFEVCSLLHTIAREQCMTIAAVVHSPSPAAFDQFDDLLLLGKGGRTIYFGPRNEAVKYFDRIGFLMPKGDSASDFFMDVATGRVPCRHSSRFRPTMLFRCWEDYTAGRDPIATLRGMTVKDRRTTMRRRTMIGAAKPSRLSSFGLPIKCWFLNVFDYIGDVGKEMADMIVGMFRRHDPVRDTPNGFVTFRLLYLRACSQLYRSRSQFWFDQIVHLLCGLFISVANQSTDYLGLFPREVCLMAGGALGRGAGCSLATDALPTAGAFITLGVLFAGVTVGSATFGGGGRERVVFWRDSSSGMSALPYFLAKWIADFPRMILATVMFTLALAIFLPFREQLYELSALILVLYFASFSMGYFLAAVLKPSSVALATTGFVLLWSLFFGGVNPSLRTVEGEYFYALIRWLWSLSAPRWGIEAYYIKETEARPWDELKTQPLNHTYDRNAWGSSLLNVVFIGLGWAFLAIVGLKLANRQKQK